MKITASSFEQMISGLHRLSHSLSRQSDVLLQEKFALGTTQFKIVWVLKKNPGGVPQKNIATWLQQTEAAVSRQMQSMQEDDLISSQVDSANRRQNVVLLTEKGNTFASQAIKYMELQQGEVFKVLSEKEQAQFCTMLQKVFDAFCKNNKWK